MTDNGSDEGLEKLENSDVTSHIESGESTKQDSTDDLDDSVVDEKVSDGHIENIDDEEDVDEEQEAGKLKNNTRETNYDNEIYDVDLNSLDHLFTKSWKRRRPVKVTDDEDSEQLSNAISSRLDMSSLPATVQNSPYTLNVELPPLSYSLPFDEIEYNITSKTYECENAPVTVYRKLEDCYFLYRQLQNNNWGKIVPPPPLKESLPERSDITQREICRVQIRRMIEEIMSDSILSADTDFQMFLKSDNFQEEAKKREQITGSLAFDKSLPVYAAHISLIKLFGPEDGKEIILSGGLESEYKGFFSFSSMPTYIETDETIIRASQRLTVLEKQFINILESLEQVRRQRTELSSVLDEFSKNVKLLADDELNKHCANVLRKFASNHEEMNRYLSHISLEEFHALYLNIDAFLRYRHSIKATFDQRITLGTYREIICTQLRKVEYNIEKLQTGSLLQFKSQERKEQSEKVHAILVKRKEILDEKFTIITNKIKYELKRFYADRTTYFKNSMGAYVTGILETQSQNKAIWESFSL